MLVRLPHRGDDPVEDPVRAGMDRTREKWVYRWVNQLEEPMAGGVLAKYGRSVPGVFAESGAIHDALGFIGLPVKGCRNSDHSRDLQELVLVRRRAQPRGLEHARCFPQRPLLESQAPKSWIASVAAYPMWSRQIVSQGARP